VDKEKEKKELFKTKDCKKSQTLISIKVIHPRSKPKWLHYYEYAKQPLTFN